jgi:hypothetical protein
MKVRVEKMKLGVAVSVILLFGLFLVAGAYAQGGTGGYGVAGGGTVTYDLGGGSKSSGTGSTGSSMPDTGYNGSEMGNQPGAFNQYNPDAAGSTGFGRNYNYQPVMPGNTPAE